MIACALAVLNAATAATVTVQPKIMVVPFVKEGEDIRTVLESDGRQADNTHQNKGGF